MSERSPKSIKTSTTVEIDYDASNKSAYIHTVIVTYWNKETEATFDEVEPFAFPTVGHALNHYRHQVYEWKLREGGGFHGDVREFAALHKDEHLRAVAIKTYSMVFMR